MVHQEYSKTCVSTTVSSIQEIVHSFQKGDLSDKPTIMEAYGGLPHDTSKVWLAIESKLQSHYVGRVPWSPKLQRYRCWKCNDSMYEHTYIRSSDSYE